MTVNREKQFTYWLEHEAKDCGLCDPPLEAQKAIQFLKNYLLGENWYVVTSESTEQVNSAIVWEILRKYSKEFRKELKQYK
jgi:hypothetical protein